MKPLWIVTHMPSRANMYPAPWGIVQEHGADGGLAGLADAGSGNADDAHVKLVSSPVMADTALHQQQHDQRILKRDRNCRHKGFSW